MISSARDLYLFDYHTLATFLSDLTVRDLTRIQSKSYKHPNGFVKIILAYNSDGSCYRLHYWLNELVADQNYHDHGWQFCSKIINGSLKNIRYINVQVEDEGKQEEAEGTEGAEGAEGTEGGEGAEETEEREEEEVDNEQGEEEKEQEGREEQEDDEDDELVYEFTVDLTKHDGRLHIVKSEQMYYMEEVLSVTYDQDDSYHLNPEVIHKAIPLEEHTITLVKQEPRTQTHCHIYSAQEIDDGSRYEHISLHELQQIISMTISILRKKAKNSTLW